LSLLFFRLLAAPMNDAEKDESDFETAFQKLLDRLGKAIDFMSAETEKRPESYAVVCSNGAGLPGRWQEGLRKSYGDFVT